MEQYIHTLISVDSDFVPDPAQVASFFDELVSQFKFSPISDRRRWLPGLLVARPSEGLRLSPERFEDIPALIEGSQHYTVTQSGQWGIKDRPVVLFKTDGVPYQESYTCIVGCELRPESVSTSAWDLEAGPNRRNIPAFGSPCKNENRNGIFPNPWTGDAIEVADAGCARFWVEFEFGKFLYPGVNNSLEVLNPSMVLAAEQCFRTKFAQGCRFR